MNKQSPAVKYMCDILAAPSVASVRCLPLRVRFKRLPEGLSDDDDPGSMGPSGDKCMNVTAEHAAELAHLSSRQASGHGLRTSGILAPLLSEDPLEYRSDCARRLDMYQSWLDLDVPLDISLVRSGDFRLALVRHQDACLRQVPHYMHIVHCDGTILIIPHTVYPQHACCRVSFLEWLSFCRCDVHMCVGE
jgi:hypothetical protein